MFEVSKKLKLTGFRLNKVFLDRLGFEYEIDSNKRTFTSTNANVLFKFLEEKTGVKPYAVGVPYLVGKSFIDENNEHFPVVLSSDSFYGDSLFVFFETENTAVPSGKKVKSDFLKRYSEALFNLDPSFVKFNSDPKVGVVVMRTQ